MTLGPHIIGANTDAWRLVRAVAASGRRPVVKLMNDWRVPDDFDAITPRPLVIGRVYLEGDLDIDPNALGRVWSVDPTATARWLIARLAHYYRGNRQVDAWELLNEKTFNDIRDPLAKRAAQWYGMFEAERARLMREEFGAGAVVGNFSTGTPHEPDENPWLFWQAFAPALVAIVIYGGLLGLHEYGGPDRKMDGYLLLKYRTVLRYCRATGKPIKIAITECGADSTPGDPPGDSWRGLKWTEREYADFLLWYNSEIEKDPEVMGATIFTWGPWEDFEVTPRITDLLIEGIRPLEIVPALPPIPTGV